MTLLVLQPRLKWYGARLVPRVLGCNKAKSFTHSTQMGYAMPTQITHGIHFRQWSRAFIVAESSDSARVVFVNVDICMGTQVLKMQVYTPLTSVQSLKLQFLKENLPLPVSRWWRNCRRNMEMSTPMTMFSSVASTHTRGQLATSSTSSLRYIYMLIFTIWLVR